MTPDPLDALQSFYSECQTAPVPESLSQLPKAPWWLRLAIPLGGVGFGCALAAVIVLSPMPASTNEGMATAEAIAHRSLAASLPASTAKTQGSLLPLRGLLAQASATNPFVLRFTKRGGWTWTA